LKWHYQFTPHDLHDWDAEQTPMLIDTPFDSTAERHLLVQANRNGFFYVLDHTDGRLLLAKPFVEKLTWASAVARTAVLNFSRAPEGARACPAVEGATNWFSSAFHSGTGLLLRHGAGEMQHLYEIAGSVAGGPVLLWRGNAPRPG
jgi:alcohol dehydrogenase (cytochrome c)